jgi:hypothetical protein
MREVLNSNLDKENNHFVFSMPLYKYGKVYLIRSPAFPFRLFQFIYIHSILLFDAMCSEIVARMGEERGLHRVLVGKPEGKRPLGRLRRRWADNIKMDLQEVGVGRGDWMELAQDRDG